MLAVRETTRERPGPIQVAAALPRNHPLLRPLARRHDSRFASRLRIERPSGEILGAGPHHRPAVRALEELYALAAAGGSADVGAFLDFHERLLWLGLWTRAERAADILLESVPEYPGALALLSGVRFEQRRRTAGAALAARALESDPDLPLALVGRAAAAGARGDFASALADLERAIGLDPGRPEPRWALGTSLFERNRFSEAAPHLRFALAHEPDPAFGKGVFVGPALAFESLLGGRVPHRVSGGESGVEVDLELRPVLPAIRAKLGGGIEGWLVVDTGASLPILHPMAAQAVRSAEGTAAAIGTSAGTARLVPALLGSLEIGDLLVEDVPTLLDEAAPSTLGPQVIGSIGVSLLREFLVTLDLQRRRIRFERPTAARPTPDPRVPGAVHVPDIPFELIGNLPIVGASFGEGPERRFLFDTGASGLFVSPTVLAEEFGLHPGDPRLRPSTTVGTGGRESSSATMPLPVSLLFGGTRFLGMHAAVSPETEEFNRAARLELAGTLGLAVWARYTLDFGRQRLDMLLLP